MPNDADRAGTPAGVFGAELRFYRTRASLSQKAQATALRWYEPLVVPGLLQTEDYARAILSARPEGNLSDLDEQVAARLARQTIFDRTGSPNSGASSTKASCMTRPAPS
jgi:hypothetical protein